MFLVTVTPDEGEPYELKVSSRDVARWEKAAPGRSLKRLEESTSMADMYDLSHVSAKRSGHFGGTAAEFLDSVDLANFRPDEPDPTNQGQ